MSIFSINNMSIYSNNVMSSLRMTELIDCAMLLWGNQNLQMNISTIMPARKSHIDLSLLADKMPFKRVFISHHKLNPLALSILLMKFYLFYSLSVDAIKKQTLAIHLAFRTSNAILSEGTLLIKHTSPIFMDSFLTILSCQF